MGDWHQGWKKIFKLVDNTGMKSNRYKLVTNRFRLEIGRVSDHQSSEIPEGFPTRERGPKNLITFKITFKKGVI